jgi:hypothetical protein
LQILDKDALAVVATRGIEPSSAKVTTESKSHGALQQKVTIMGHDSKRMPATANSKAMLSLVMVSALCLSVACHTG